MLLSDHILKPYSTFEFECCTVERYLVKFLVWFNTNKRFPVGQHQAPSLSDCQSQTFNVCLTVKRKFCAVFLQTYIFPLITSFPRTFLFSASILLQRGRIWNLAQTLHERWNYHPPHTCSFSGRKSKEMSNLFFLPATRKYEITVSDCYLLL